MGGFAPDTSQQSRRNTNRVLYVILQDELPFATWAHQVMQMFPPHRVSTGTVCASSSRICLKCSSIIKRALEVHGCSVLLCQRTPIALSRFGYIGTQFLKERLVLASHDLCRVGPLNGPASFETNPNLHRWITKYVYNRAREGTRILHWDQHPIPAAVDQVSAPRH